MKSILFLALVAVSCTSLASTYTCKLSETLGDKTVNSEYTVESADGALAEMEIQSQLGLVRGKVTFDKNQAVFSNKDIETDKYVLMAGALKDGEFVRFMQNFTIIEDVQIYDLVCQRGLKVKAEDQAPEINCKLIEKEANTETVTDFKVPMSASGHDTTPIPAGKFGTVKGWVLAYQGIVGINMSDATDYRGRWIGAFGSIQGGIIAEWYTDKESEIKSIISCEGLTSKEK